MTTNLNAESLRPVDAMNALIARHGVARIMLAVPAALLQRHFDRTTLSGGLSAHMLRDIGLTPQTDRSSQRERR
jgi:hypothetical protein